ncbi:hypothetical protein [Nocardia anaemiae]|uniref:hypothetical protein n=1 Tax=Nocardia anaemiae TaxID=263910 RepID=UPI0007A50EB4|nr:hypothetical protein [Nocardia anaemiae]
MIRRATPDIRFARRVLDTIAHLPDHPHHPGMEWDQRAYRFIHIHDIIHADTGAPVCRTTMCFAGWVVELDPDVAWAYDSMTLRTAGLADDTTCPPVQLAPDLTTARDLTTGRNLRASAYARRRLGLTVRQADELFFATNTLDDLTEAIDRIGKGQLL